MRFSDKLQIQALCYEPNYAVIGGKAFIIDNNGGITGNVDEEQTEELLTNGRYDEEGNSITPIQRWVTFGKCVIFPNSKAQKIRLNDGKEYIYAYELVAPLKKSLYPLIPEENDNVKIIKEDGTINKDMTVQGFVTLKKRYLKLWL